ncbi:MAG: hypothetical protein JXR49_09475 [Acidobacteria bacterium]|nr:hypothetical protein [Acidobacteriota bacterium]
MITKSNELQILHQSGYVGNDKRPDPQPAMEDDQDFVHEPEPVTPDDIDFVPLQDSTTKSKPDEPDFIDRLIIREQQKENK